MSMFPLSSESTGLDVATLCSLADNASRPSNTFILWKISLVCLPPALSCI